MSKLPVLPSSYKDKIHQVIYNLVSNAVKFSPKNTTMHISLKEKTARLLYVFSIIGGAYPKKVLIASSTVFTKPKWYRATWNQALGWGIIFAPRL